MPHPTLASARSRALRPDLWALPSPTVQPTLWGKVPTSPPPHRRRVVERVLPQAEAATAFQRHRNLPVWRHGLPVSGPEPVDEAIEGFRPTGIDLRVWLEIAPFARASVRETDPSSARGAAALMSKVAQHLAWCHGMGMDMRPEVVWHVDATDHFTVEGLADHKGGTPATYRSALRTVGEAVLGPDACPARQSIQSRPDPETPYSDLEIADLLGAVRGLTTEHRRENALTIFAAGLGFGPPAADLSGLCGTDVHRDSDVVAVNISYGKRPRRAVVAAGWEDVLLDRAEQVGERPMFRPDRDRIGALDVSKFLDSLTFDHLPRLTVQRLRVTWIVGCLRRGVAIQTVAAAAGVGETQIARYFRFLDDIDPTEADRALRGGT